MAGRLTEEELGCGGQVDGLGRMGISGLDPGGLGAACSELVDGEPATRVADLGFCSTAGYMIACARVKLNVSQVLMS